MTTTLVTNDAVEFWPPAVKTAPYGLFHHVNWWPDARDEAQDETDSAVDLQELPNAQEHYRPGDEGDPLLTALEQGRGWCDSDLDPHADRFLLGGVRFRTFNYGESSSTGTWDGPWCSEPSYPPSQTKGGTRPGFPANYEPVTAWAFDMCDLTPYSYVETQMHAQQWLRLTAPNAVEQALATRMLSDAGTLPSAVDFTTALGQLEGAIAQTNTVGYIHAAPALASAASRSSQLVRHPDGTLTTHLGNVFGVVAPQFRDLVVTVDEGIAELGDLVRRADAAVRVAHLPTIEDRNAARRLVLDLTPPAPTRPAITKNDLARAQWAAVVADPAKPYSAALSQLLETHAVVAGQSVSDCLLAVLKRIDAAALSFGAELSASRRRNQSQARLWRHQRCHADKASGPRRASRAWGCHCHETANITT